MQLIGIELLGASPVAGPLVLFRAEARGARCRPWRRRVRARDGCGRDARIPEPHRVRPRLRRVRQGLRSASRTSSADPEEAPVAVANQCFATCRQYSSTGPPPKVEEALRVNPPQPADAPVRAVTRRQFEPFEERLELRPRQPHHAVRHARPGGSGQSRYACRPEPALSRPTPGSSPGRRVSSGNTTVTPECGSRRSSFWTMDASALCPPRKSTGRVAITMGMCCAGTIMRAAPSALRRLPQSLRSALLDVPAPSRMPTRPTTISTVFCGSGSAASTVSGTNDGTASFSKNQPTVPSGPAPPRQLTRGNPMPTRHVIDHRPRRQKLS